MFTIELEYTGLEYEAFRPGTKLTIWNTQECCKSECYGPTTGVVHRIK